MSVPSGLTFREGAQPREARIGCVLIRGQRALGSARICRFSNRDVALQSGAESSAYRRQRADQPREPEVINQAHVLSHRLEACVRRDQQAGAGKADDEEREIERRHADGRGYGRRGIEEQDLVPGELGAGPPRDLTAIRENVVSAIDKRAMPPVDGIEARRDAPDVSGNQGEGDGRHRRDARGRAVPRAQGRLARTIRAASEPAATGQAARPVGPWAGSSSASSEKSTSRWRNRRE